MQLRMEEGFPANREEYFYSDPLLAPGRRVYNCLSAASHSVFDWFRLQTPPPIMSSCIFPSTYQDNPMSDEDVSGDPLDDRPPVAMAAPCCSPSPALYTPSELDAACGLLHLSSAVSR
ncbi:histone deacetylase complex subunit SAP25 [Eleutherodactylus coqui]|uniref:histone deacetylase complex subunit SAP25 n=1 Tax=Eleutherodactylus coqui TaxID=57060 RepID=UPI003462C1BD